MKKVKIKICGLKQKEDVEFLNKFPVDYIGFIMYPPSPRYVGDSLSELISRVEKAKKVVVFVNPTYEEIKKVLDCGADLIQLHGDENLEFAKKIGLNKVIKAFRIKNNFTSIEFLEEWRDAYGVLLDAYKPGVPGGTGETFNWNIAKIAVLKGLRVFLAGGISPENIQKAIEEVKPYAIDIASGVESEPGKKDHKKIEQIFKVLS